MANSAGYEDKFLLTSSNRILALMSFNYEIQTIEIQYIMIISIFSKVKKYPKYSY